MSKLPIDFSDGLSPEEIKLILQALNMLYTFLRRRSDKFVRDEDFDLSNVYIKKIGDVDRLMSRFLSKPA